MQVSSSWINTANTGYFLLLTAPENRLIYVNKHTQKGE